MQTTTTETTAASMTAAMNSLRAAFPRLRRTQSVAIVHTGSKRTVFQCVCGARHTCATNYRKAKHVAAFCDEHADCAARLAAKLERGEAVRVHFGMC